MTPILRPPAPHFAAPLLAVLLVASAALPGLASPGPRDVPAEAEGAVEAPAMASPPGVPGAMIRVDDLERAVAFYRDLAGFEVRGDGTGPPGRVHMVNGGVALVLLEVDRPIHHEYPATAEGHLNVQVGDLQATLGELAQRNVPRLVDEPLVAVIGPNLPITDPAGNLVYVLELYQQEEPLPRPRIFNFGITVPDMARARSFYEGLLGFTPFSEEFYPPVIPYVRSGAMSVVLHESATGPSPVPPPDSSQVNLLLAVEDVAAVAGALAAAGVEVRRPAAGGLPGETAEVVDPFGNVHVLLELRALTPGGEEPDPSNAAGGES